MTPTTQPTQTTRIVIIGNAGSGKSTLARRLAAAAGAPTLDLDTIFWEPGKIAVARPTEAVHADLDRFCAAHDAYPGPKREITSPDASEAPESPDAPPA